MSDQLGFDANAGVYGQVGGASLSIAVGTDGVTVLIGGQYSLIYAVNGASVTNLWSSVPVIEQL